MSQTQAPGALYDRNAYLERTKRIKFVKDNKVLNGLVSNPFSAITVLTRSRTLGNGMRELDEEEL